MIAPTIYLLVGQAGYEDDDIVAAYESKGAADAEAARLNDLLRAAPKLPPDDDAAKWERYNRAVDRWRKKFPGPYLGSCDCFAVREISFIVAATPAEDSPCTPPADA